MSNLVVIKKQEVFADSRVIAEKFGKAHRSVLEKIDNLIKDLDDLGAEKSTTKFIENTKHYRGQVFRFYLLNKEAYDLTIMAFTGKKALKHKLDYVNAFRSMEKYIKNKQDVSWISKRQESKQIRNSMTDAIKLLVEHAKNQGSENADRYYSSITKMEYKALDFIYKTDVNFRDTLEMLDISKLEIAEKIVEEVILKSVENDMYYKDIYQECKKTVLNYAESISMLRKA